MDQLRRIELEAIGLLVRAGGYAVSSCLMPPGAKEGTPLRDVRILQSGHMAFYTDDPTRVIVAPLNLLRLENYGDILVLNNGSGPCPVDARFGHAETEEFVASLNAYNERLGRPLHVSQAQYVEQLRAEQAVADQPLNELLTRLLGGKTIAHVVKSDTSALCVTFTDGSSIRIGYHGSGWQLPEELAKIAVGELRVY